MRVEIYFPVLPLTLNELIKICSEDSREYHALKKRYTRNCAIWAASAPQFKGKVWLHFHWHLRTALRDPADNTQAAAKPILDGLVEIGVLPGDSCKAIQPPIAITWDFAKTEGLTLTISTKPIFQLVPID